MECVEMAEYFLKRLHSQGAWFEAMMSLSENRARPYAAEAKPDALKRRSECAHPAILIDSIGDAFCEDCSEDLT
jgi:hypothetical protein